MLVNNFYDGMSPSMKQLLETMCRGDFLSKNPEEAMGFLNYMAEASKAWDEPNPREVKRMRPATSSRGDGGGGGGGRDMYSLPEDMEVNVKLSTVARRLEELEMRNQYEVRTVAKTPVPNKLCFIF